MKPNDIRQIKIVLWVMVAIAFIIGIVSPFSAVGYRPEYIPDAVRGLTTIIGILCGFVGFCLAYSHSAYPNGECKKIVKKRILPISFLILFSLLLTSFAYTSLVAGALVPSYTSAVGGFIMTLGTFLETLMLLDLEPS